LWHFSDMSHVRLCDALGDIADVAWAAGVGKCRMPKTEDEHQNVVEPPRRTEDDSVRFGRYLLNMIVVIVVA
jgi:hypothetical protein